MNLPKKCEASTNTSIAKAVANFPAKRGSDGFLSMSVYQGQPATKPEMTQAVMRLQAAFPSLQPTVLKTIIDRAIELQMPLQRIVDGINHTIDTCEFPSFTPAKVLSYDLKCKLFTYDEACDIQYRTQNPKAVVPIVVRGKRLYVSPADKAKYNLPNEIF